MGDYFADGIQCIALVFFGKRGVANDGVSQREKDVANGYRCGVSEVSTGTIVET
jgi:hypothetical protein